MRALAAFLLACASLRADFRYESRIQFDGSEPIVTTRAIKGVRMAILTHKHTEVIDLDAETITEIDAAKKTYSVTPFAAWKKVLDDAAAKGAHETSFKVLRHPAASPSSSKPIGVVNSAESTIDITGASSGLNATADTWVGTVPGYEQMRDYIDLLAAKLGYTFAAGLAEPALRVPECLAGLDEAIKQLNQSVGAPIQTTIKITTPKIATQDKSIAVVSIQLGKFEGGAQQAVIFNTPDGFKKVDAPAPGN